MYYCSSYTRLSFLSFLFLFGIQSDVLVAQCNETYLNVLGGSISNERGYAIASSPTNRVVYVSATRADSLIIIKFDSLGQLLWSRRLEVEIGRAESVNGMIIDAEGNLAIVGTVGNIDQQGSFFACRYDPDANIMLWAVRLMSHSQGFASGISEMGPGGDYVMYTNPTNTNDAELLKLDKATGNIYTTFSKHYNLGNAETISDLILFNNVLYGIGRFTEGNAFEDMRTAIFSLDSANGNVYWSKLGHRPTQVNARLYGVDMAIANNSIYGLSCGDENGGSIDDTEMYIQKLDLNGNVDWVKRYNLPGPNDWVDEIIDFEGGLITMARNRISPSDIILLKTDYDGNVLWSKQYDVATNDNSVTLGGITSQLTALDGFLYFTAFVDNGSNTDILLLRTDRDGNINQACQNVKSINIPAISIPSPVFYDVAIEVTQFTPIRTELPVNAGVAINLEESLVCGTPATIQSQVTATICEGESHEGYTVAGTYTDVFVTQNGCDSTRTLQLIVVDEFTISISKTICEGEQHQGYTETGIYVDQFQSVLGCDSIRTLHLQVVPCQVECGEFSAAVYGIPGVGEHGQCLVTTPENDGVYIAANKEDSTLLIKVDLNGNWVWTKVIDAIPNDHEIPTGILVDAEGMIAVSGTARNPVSGGSLYVIRYDPYLHQVLWAHEYSHSPNDFNFDIEEKGNGGNYLLANQATFNNGAFNDAGIAEIDKATGSLVANFQKNYHLYGTETLHELIYYDDYVYGVARYKDVGPNNLQMRHTLVKLDPANGDQVWVKMGHLPPTSEARLYGTDMLIDNDNIISLYHGDPVGHTTTMTEVYIQRTDLDGNLIWLKRYDLPGNNPFGYEIIASGNGYVAYTTEVSTGEHFIFKIDAAGNVLWAKRMTFYAGADIFYAQRGNQLLVQAGNKLVMTGAVVNSNGDADMFIIMSDLDGNVTSPCVESESVTITATNVPNPVFYSVTPEVKNPTTTADVLNVLLIDSAVPILPQCEVSDTLYTHEAVTICEGEDYKGYTMAGTYQDTFQTADGCDSISILTLDVVMETLDLNIQVCDGQTYEGYSVSGSYTDTLPGINGECDTLRFLDLFIIPAPLTHINATFCAGETFLGYNATGMYADTFLNVNGCDSIRTLNLTILPLMTSEVTATICQGSSYLGYTSSGTHIDTLIDIGGCDSIRMLHLTVLPFITSTISVSICAGEDYLGYTATGMYADTFTTSDGCDSVRVLSLAVEPAITTFLQQNICAGEVFEGYNMTGMYVDTLVSVTGCDSIRMLQLNVGYLTSQLTLAICEGESYDGYTETGIYIDTLNGASSACDTIRTLDLTVISTIHTTLDQVICAEENFEGYNASGVYVDTLISSSGCDSVRVLHLEKLAPLETILLANACDPAIPGNQPIGTYIDTLISVRGCDSIRILTVEGTSVYIPNVFTPNNDGINDVFVVHPYPTDSLDLEYFAIYDRFGDMTYQTQHWPITWHGDDADKRPFQPGVFAYVLIYHCGNRRIIEHGDITLVK